MSASTSPEKTVGISTASARLNPSSCPTSPETPIHVTNVSAP
ncbi:hypothetical protein [Halococcus hamelinensis]|nr:hypothetical protein [Halococcus hamelinensis]